MKTIPSGWLDRRIEIRRPTTAENSLGQPTGAFELVATVWASYYEKLFTRVYAEREAVAATEYFLIRWRSDLNETMVIDYAGVRYEIDRIAEAVEYGRRVGLKLYVRNVR